MGGEMVSIQTGQALDIDKTLTLAKILAEGGVFDIRGAAQAVAKIMTGHELGIGPVSSLINITLIKNKVTLSATLLAALIRRSGRYDYRVRRLDDQGCVIEVLMNGQPVGSSTFTIEDAKRAGLAGGENYRKFPKNMVFARALSNAARWYCPDVFNGAVYTPDELNMAQLDPETGTLLSLPAGPVTEAEVVGPEPATETESLHARVANLIAQTNTDLPKLLAHYRVTTIDNLTPDQCTEAIQVLTLRKRANEFPVSQ
jgi:hypothetical protein